MIAIHAVVHASDRSLLCVVFLWFVVFVVAGTSSEYTLVHMSFSEHIGSKVKDCVMLKKNVISCFELI